MDPQLAARFKAIAKDNHWAEPVASKSVPTELKDDQKAGGSVRKQPLMPFVSDLGTRDKFDMRFAVSRSGKTVSSKFVAFFIADDNTLHYRRNSSSFYVHIRRFADDKATGMASTTMRKPRCSMVM